MLVKVQVFVPRSHVDTLRLALGESGLGKIGNYDNTFFVTCGKSYFRPLSGANPTIGQIGKIEEVDECKLEFIAQQTDIPKMKLIIKENHPYEEVALDILPMLDS